ncbi:hypothetical protein, partial [Candidatus Hamiltonella defensa]
DWRKLYQTLSDPLLYSQFMNQIQSLMQLSDTHDQFMSVTGQSCPVFFRRFDRYCQRSGIINLNRKRASL